jgi:hypothetical protein
MARQAPGLLRTTNFALPHSRLVAKQTQHDDKVLAAPTLAASARPHFLQSAWADGPAATKCQEFNSACGVDHFTMFAGYILK